MLTKTFTYGTLFLLSSFLVYSHELADLPPKAFEASEHRIESEGVLLEARFYRPIHSLPGKGCPVIVTVSGSGSNDTTADPYTMMLVGPWVKTGIGVLAFNKRGTGKSGGSYSETDFDQRARDVVNVLQFARKLPGVDPHKIGLWGISQAGWVIPKVVVRLPDIRFAILVSPAGVSPARQVEFYMENEFGELGLTQEEIVKAAKLNHAIMAYYGTRKGYDEARKLLAEAADTAWYLKIRNHPFWHEMPAPDRLYSPEELNVVVKNRPKDFSWYLSASTFEDYSDEYRKITIPLLILYGGRDQLVPIQESIAVFKESLQQGTKADVVFRIFDQGDHNLQISETQFVPGYTEQMTEWIEKQLDSNSSKLSDLPLRRVL